ncbi:MAG: 50S ribosomal protein L4, partial [Longimicrobiales bacterium]|nr:50S ribosomal protein L4 [Longimicrobiales bacterium]
MFKARTYKADGKKGKAQSLPDSIFDGVVNEGAMHQVVKVYLSNQRQGTSAAKTRSEVRGGSRKPWRQKGTGRARAGTTRASQWVGGGVAFPPIPHSWRKGLPKKLRNLARRSALNDRAEHDRVVVAELPSMDAPKTQALLGFVGALALEGKTLILTNGKNDNIYLSSRNLDKVSVLRFGDESVYDVLWANTVVIEKGSFAAVAPAEEEVAAKPEAEKKVAPKKKAAPKKDAALKKDAAPKKKAALKKDAAPKK